MARLVKRTPQLALGDDRHTVHSGSLLGAQYGLADLLEREGYGFFHPFEARAPKEFPRLTPSDDAQRLHTAQVGERGLHLHTLHPIEAYFDLWPDQGGDLNHAERIFDWVVKNRGNGVNNPDAMFRKGVTVEEVLASRLVCEPLHLWMLCSPNEGAAAVVAS